MQAFHQRPSTLTMPPANTARAGEQHAGAASMDTSDDGCGCLCAWRCPVTLAIGSGVMPRARAVVPGR